MTRFVRPCQLTRRTTLDFEGDNRADLAVFARQTRPGMCSTFNTAYRHQLVFQATRSAGYDGDGKTDIAVYRPDNGVRICWCSTVGFTAVRPGLSIATDAS